MLVSLAAAILIAETVHRHADGINDAGQNVNGYTKTECQTGFRSGLTRLRLGCDAVTGSDGSTTLGRTDYCKNSDQPAAAQRHEDRVAQVIVGRVLQRTLTSYLQRRLQQSHVAVHRLTPHAPAYARTVVGVVVGL
jgi:hypothetical protein